MAGSSFAGGLALAYAHYIEPFWLDVTYNRVPLSLENFSGKWRGFKVAFLTDFHMGEKGQPLRTLSEAVNRTLALKPDLVLMGGDYFTKGIWNPHFGRLLSPLLEANLAVTGILGNHDYFGRRRDAERIIGNLENLGITMLRNRAVEISYKGEKAWMVGLDDFEKGEPDLCEATRGLKAGEKPLIVVAHNPMEAQNLPSNFTNLILSGHTHGGQVNPALPPFEKKLNWTLYVPDNHHTEYPLGWYEVNGNRLYVSRGLGMSKLMLRFNSRPELSVLEFV